MPTRSTTAAAPSERFKDVDPDIDRKKNIISIDQFEDKQFDVKKVELDTGVQVRGFEERLFSHEILLDPSTGSG